MAQKEIPDSCSFDVRDFGAIGDGRTLATGAIRAAVAAAAAAVVAAAVSAIGVLVFRSGMHGDLIVTREPPSWIWATQSPTGGAVFHSEAIVKPFVASGIR